MSPLDRLVRHVQRRLWLGCALRETGRWTCVSMSVALALVIGDRVFSFTQPWWLIVLAAASGIPVGLLLASATRKPAVDTAGFLDQTLHLFNRMRSALELQRGSTPSRSSGGDVHDQAFASILRHDADVLAQSINPRKAAPLRWPSTWTWTLVLTTATVAGAWWVPDFSVFSESETRYAAELRAQQEAARQRARSAIESIEQSISLAENNREPNEQAPTDDADTNDPLNNISQNLDRLREQLASADDAEDDVESSSSGNSDPAPAIASDPESEAAGELMRMADELEQAAAQRQLESDELARRLSDLELDEQRNGTEISQSEQSLNDAVEALRRGDGEDAARILEQLQRQTENMSLQEREELAQRMQDLARQIEESQQPATPEELAQQTEERIRDLEDLGFTPEDAQQLAEGANRHENIPDERWPDSLDEFEKDRLREQLEQDQRNEQAQRETDQRMQDLSEGMREWAESLEQNQPAESAESTEPAERASDSESSPEENQLREGNREQFDQRSTDQSSDQIPQPQEQQQQPDQQDQSNQEGSPERNESPSEINNENQTGEQEQRPSGTPDAQPTPGETPAPAPTPTPTPDQMSPTSDRITDTQQPEGGSPEQAPSPPDMPTPPQGVDRIQEIARRMQRSDDQTARDREISERMRREARRLMQPSDSDESQSSPASDSPMPPGVEPSDSDTQNAMGMNREDTNESSERGPGAGTGDDDNSPTDPAGTADQYLYDVDDVDARSTRPEDEASRSPDFNDDDLVIEEWLDREDMPIEAPGENVLRRTDAPTNNRSIPSHRVREASRQVERALNEQAIPSRYADLLRRWAGRLERVMQNQSSDRSEGQEGGN